MVMKLIPAPDNKPGAREGAVSWTSPDGKFWLMGGEGCAAIGFGRLNDLWKYDPATNEWTIPGLMEILTNSSIWNLWNQKLVLS